MVLPVSKERIQIATDFGLSNVPSIAKVCREVGIPFYGSCALFEKESMGKHVYGHDVGGTFSGFPKPVNKGNWDVFRWMVIDLGMPSNGVGPSQLTSRTFFLDMEKRGLRPWAVEDNMFYGLELLWGYYNARGKSWVKAGTAYNGAVAYGQDLSRKAAAWKRRLHVG